MYHHDRLTLQSVVQSYTLWDLTYTKWMISFLILVLNGLSFHFIFPPWYYSEFAVHLWCAQFHPIPWLKRIDLGNFVGLEPVTSASTVLIWVDWLSINQYICYRATQEIIQHAMAKKNKVCFGNILAIS